MKAEPCSAATLADHIKSAIEKARKSREPTSAPVTEDQIHTESAERWLERLHHVRRHADILGFPQMPIRRSIDHILWTLLEHCPEAPVCDFTEIPASHALIIRTAAIGVFERLLSRLNDLENRIFISVVCHEKDRAMLADRAPRDRSQVLVYPRFEPYAPVELRRLLEQAPRQDWKSIILLDNATAGTGKDLPHIAAALTPWREIPTFVFNAGGHLHGNPFAGLLGNSREAILVRQLLAFLDRAEKAGATTP